MRLDIADFTTFLVVARHLNFRAAADELGLSASAISHAIRQLEQRLKIRLFNRTTRSVALTEAGNNLYARLRPAFDEIHTILDEVNCYRDTPSGILRINAARTAARLVLMPLLADFTRLYPDLRVEVTASDRMDDIAGEGYDAGIRLSGILEKDMIAVPIGPPLRLRVVATPLHFARYGVPSHPRDLLDHPCVAFRFPGGRPYHWDFIEPDGRLEIAVKGNIVVNDMDAELDAVLHGAGVGYLFDLQVGEYLQSEKLVSVLDDWLPELPAFQLYYPHRQYMSCALRVLIDYIKAQPGSPGYTT